MLSGLRNYRRQVRFSQRACRGEIWPPHRDEQHACVLDRFHAKTRQDYSTADRDAGSRTLSSSSRARSTEDCSFDSIVIFTL